MTDRFLTKEALIDRDIHHAFCDEMGEEITQEFLVAFSNSLNTAIEQLTRAPVTPPTVIELAHAIASTAELLGCLALAKLARDIDLHRNEPPEQLIDLDIDTFVALLIQTRAFVESRLSG